MVQLQVKNGDGSTNLALIDDILSFQAKRKNFISKSKPINIPIKNVLSVTLDKTKDVRVVIKALVPKSKVKLKLKIYSFEVINEEAAQSWIKTTDFAAYNETKKKKHFKIFVNPFGGAGKGEKVFNKLVKPIFDAAGCTYDISLTEYPNHAKNIAESLDLKNYDAIITVSGDGIIHEIINGLLSRHDAPEIDIPIGTIPAGSGNALSTCLLGNDLGISIPHAVLNIIKGVPMKIDICSVTQGDKRYFAFMTLNYGLIADADVSTDHLRWMNNLRFFVGLIQALFGNRKYKCKLEVKIAESNIEKIKQEYIKSHEASPVTDIQDKSRSLVDLKFGTVNDPIPQDWTVLNDDGYIFFAGKVPWISRDTIVFPFALPSDGLLDLLIVKRDNISKIKAIKILLASDSGKHVNMEGVTYYKVEAFRLTPHKENGYFSIDGEKAPFEPFQVEVHSKLISIISPNGKYFPTIPISKT